MAGRCSGWRRSQARRLGRRGARSTGISASDPGDLQRDRHTESLSGRRQTVSIKDITLSNRGIQENARRAA
jgi:hypothetical protein